MAESKYEKYLYNDIILQGRHAKRLGFDGYKSWGINYWMRWTYIAEPYTMEEKPHTHDYDQCCHFYGGDPKDVEDFQAEVWFYIGGEKQVITKPTVVYVPKGTLHCPLIYKRIDKPIIFQNVAFAGEYVKTMENGEVLKVKPGH
jgi:hypothetical protein